MVSNIRSFSLFLLIILLSGKLIAQNNESSNLFPSKEDSLRVGLALSGGGALGIAHIGVIQAIEEAGIRIDYITGTSMGSLVGGLYAIGYTSDQLVEIATSSNFVELFTKKENRIYLSNYEKIKDNRTIATFPVNEKRIDLPRGIITGQNVYTYLSRLTRSVHGIDKFENFPIPFAAVATDLETGNAKVFSSGYLPDALRASISIPSLFIPHEIDGKLYVDGGLIRNIPVEDAIEMGANYTIAVDVSSPLMTKDSLNTFAKVLNQSVYFRIHDYADVQREMADYAVRIKELEPYSATDFDKADELLQIGREAGKKHLEEFKKIAARQNTHPQERKPLKDTGSFPVQNIVIEGNSLYDDEFIINQLDFIPGSILEYDTIEEKVTKLYSSQYIENVTYRLLPLSDNYYTLQINIEENETDEFRVGVRYETGNQASILLESTFHNLLHEGSLTNFENRLGNRINFQADHLYYGALGSNLALLSSLQYMKENVNWYDGRNRIAQFRNQIIRAEISGGNFLSSQNLFSIGIRREFNFISSKINFNDIEVSESDYHSVFARFVRDKLNRNGYPTNGHHFILEGHYSNDFIFSEINFTSSDLYYNGFYQVDDDVSLTNSLWLGYTTGRELPWEYWKTPNRYDSIYNFIRFGGTEPYQISARNSQMTSFGIQFEPFYHRFLNFDFYMGRFQENWSFIFNADEFEYGASVSFGALTIIGPAKLILSTNTLNSFRAELQIGYQF